MENPFVIDWEEQKNWHLNRDWRHFAACIGAVLILLPLPSVIPAHFHHEARIIVGSLIYGVCLLAGGVALSLLLTIRSFKKEVTRQAPVKRYVKLLELCHIYPKTGEQCRAAAADLLSRQGYLTEWQVEVLIQDMKELGDEERLETLKAAFLREAGIHNGEGD